MVYVSKEAVEFFFHWGGWSLCSMRLFVFVSSEVVGLSSMRLFVSTEVVGRCFH